MGRDKLIAGMLFAAMIGYSSSGYAAEDRFGAIAYSPDTHAIGIAADNTSQSEAEEVALHNCQTDEKNPTDCRNVMWVRNACAAIAMGDDGGWGTDWAVGADAADKKAVAECSKYSQTCKVVQRVCVEAE